MMLNPNEDKGLAPAHGQPSTRLILKNLPKSITVDKIRSLFSAHGQVTDVQLKYNSATKAFRGFGFLGFRTVDEAAKAQAYFNNTYIGTTKIQVLPCTTLKQKQQRPGGTSGESWNRKRPQTAPDQSHDQKPKKKKKEEEILEKCTQDPLFREFLESHTKKSGWSNDEIISDLERAVGKPTRILLPKSLEVEPKSESSPSAPPKIKKKSKKTKKKKSDKAPETEETPTPSPVQPEQTKKKKKKRRQKSTLSSDHQFFTVKLRDLPQKAKKKDVKGFFESCSLVPKSIRFPPAFRGVAYVGFGSEDEQARALTKNKSWLFANKITVIKVTEKKPDPSAQNAQKWTEQSDSLAEGAEDVEESGRIFIRNLSYTTNEEEIRELFSKYGPITEVNLPLDRLTRQIKGFGFISFMLPEHAAAAMSELDGSIFQGRMLHLLPSKPQPSESETGPENPDAKSSYKKLKDAKTKKLAGSSHNWNSLFLSQNAIGDIIAEKYGVSREELLLGNSDDNPKGSSSAAVRMALAETEIVDETRNFLIDNGVCLEAFEDDPSVNKERSKTTFLIKNLPANTTTSELLELYSKYGEIGRVVLPPSGVTGIMEFLEPAEARGAFKKTAYTNFRGVPLYLEWAPVGTWTGAPGAPAPVNRSATLTSTSTAHQPQALMSIQLSKKEPEEPKAKPSVENQIDPSVPEPDKDQNANTKLLVRNVPFQATQSEILQLFKTFGDIKACRLPLKTDGTGDHRGFGFVEFLTKSEATRALETLGKSTHLYGRRLVIEYARGTETVEQLRTKTAKQYELRSSGSGGGAGAGHSTKKQITRYFNIQKEKATTTKAQEEEEEEEDQDMDEQES